MPYRRGTGGYHTGVAVLRLQWAPPARGSLRLGIGSKVS